MEKKCKDCAYFYAAGKPSSSCRIGPNKRACGVFVDKDSNCYTCKNLVEPRQLCPCIGTCVGRGKPFTLYNLHWHKDCPNYVQK